jgi:hypothetical protein
MRRDRAPATKSLMIQGQKNAYGLYLRPCPLSPNLQPRTTSRAPDRRMRRTRRRRADSRDEPWRV